MASKKEKVCIFSAQYFPNVGGVERYTYNLAKKLVEKEIDVTIVTSNNHKSPDYEMVEGIKIYRLPCYNMMSGRFPVVTYNRKCREILRKISEKHYTLVITNTRFYFHSLIGVIFGKRYGDKSIVIEHGTTHLSVHNTLLDYMEQLFEHGLTVIVKLFCKDFYGVSEACTEWLKHFHIKAKGVLYNSIDVKMIEKMLAEDSNNLFGTLQLPENAKIIAFTGRILPEKGVIELVEAFEKIRIKYPECYLLIAGDGPMLEELQRKNFPQVKFLGQISFNQVISMLKNSHIFCLPSVSEGMPTSVLEAIACRNFVITTARGGAREIILDDSYGIIMDNNNVSNIVQGLEKVLKNEEYRQKAVEKSYQRLTERFTWDQVADKVIEIMKK